MKKRILSLFMAFVLCLTLLPTAALAASGDGSISDGVIDGSSSTGEGGGIYVPPGSPTEGGGGTYIPGEDTQAETQPVTVVSGGTETGYGSIVTAFSEAVTGNTIRLNADVSLEASNLDDGVTADTALAVSGKRITLDLNGYVLGSYSVPITVRSGAGLTLINANGENSSKYASTPTALKIGLRLDLLVEKGGSFTCTDGMFQSLKLLSTGEGGYDLTLAKGENHCTFGFFSSEDETAAVDDVLKANHAGMALHASYVGADVQFERTKLIKDLVGQPFYVGPCSEHQMAADGACIYCGASYVVRVAASDGQSTSYTSLDDALSAAKDGDTVTLLSDAEITKWHPLTAAITLDLSGKTVTILKEASLSIHARVIVQDSSTDQTGKMYCATAGDAVSHVLDVQERGDLIIRSGIFDGEIWARSGIGSALTIEGGTFNKEVALEASVSISLSGGEFKSIWYTGDSFLNLLADGHAFYGTDGKLVNVSKNTGRYLNNVKVREHTQHTFTDGACGCGYTCPHTSVDASGVCAVCKKQFAASVTASDGSVTYYDVFYQALNAASAGSTLTLLADVTEFGVTLDREITLDLNGHSIPILHVTAEATLTDSAAVKGTIGTLSIGNSDPDADAPTIVLGDLMTGGDSLKANGTWLPAAQLFGTSANNVSVDKTGITGVTANAPESVIYGQTGTTPITLTVTPADIETLTFEWFELKDNNEWSRIPNEDGDAYHPAALNVGSHTIRCAVMSTAGYVLSNAVTVAVTRASIAGADVTLVKSSFEYDGTSKTPEVESVTLPGKKLAPGTDYYVDVTPQTDAGSYTLTVIGRGNYSGKFENVEWKIEPIKIDSVMVSSDISKVYDGTAEINMTAEEWAEVLTFKKLSAYPVVDVPSTAYTISDAYFVEKRDGECFDSPDAGEKYGIAFKITLNSSNYVLQTYGEDTPSTSKEITQSGPADFTIKQANVTSPGEITQLVFNDLAKTYTLDLAALLPELSEGCEYGDIQYQGCNYHFTDNTYLDSNNDMSVSREGILTLPTVSAHTSNVNTQIGTITVPVATTNYQKFEFTINVVISARIPPNASGVTVSASDITYGQTLNESKLTATGMMKHPGTGEEVKGTFAWTDGTVKPNAGDYEAEWAFTPDEPIYASVTGKVDVKVKPAKLTVSVKASRAYYTGKAQIASIIASGQNVDSTPVTFTYSDKVDGNYTSDGPTFTDAGTYTAYYKAEAANHEPATGTFTVTIDPLPISLFTVDKLSKTYDGTADAALSADMLTFFSKAAKRSGITLTDTALTISNARFTTPQADGSYLPSPEVGGGKALSFTMTLTDGNYVFADEPEGTSTVSSDFATDDTTRFTVTKAAAPEVTVRPAVTVINGLAKTYEMVLSDSYLPKLDSLCEYGNVSYSVKGIYLTDGYEDTVTAEIVEENGQYKLKLTVPAVDYDKESSVGTLDIKVVSDNYQDFTLSIGVKAKNKTVPVPDGEISATDITYGQTLADSNITGKMKDGSKEVTGTFKWNTPDTVLNAGNHEAEWTFTPDAPEYAAATGKATVKVNPKSIEGAIVTLEEDSFVYDGTVKEPKIISVVLDGVSLAGPGRDKDYGYSYNRTSEVGTYNDFTIAGQNNYTGEIKLTWSITAREVTPVIEVADGSYVYDEGKEIKPAITVKDDLDNIIDPKEYEVSYSNNTNAGTAATVTVTDKSGGNYVLGTASKTFQIAKANSTAIAPTANDLTYNGKNQALVTAGTANGGTMVYRLGDSGEFVSDIPTGKGAGAYTVYYKIAGDDNHYDTVPQSITVTIKQAKVTVTAENRRSRVGQPLLELTYTCEPALFGGDAFTGALVCEADKDMTGNYEITQGSLTLSGNYELTFIKGTYTVTEKLVQDNFRFSDSARTVTYGDANFTFTAVGAADDSTVTYSSSDETVATVDSTGKVTIKGAGNAKITAVASETADYDAAVASYDLTVNKADITIAAKNQSAHVGDTVPALGADSYTVTGLVNGEQLKAAPTVRYVDDSGNEITPDMTKIGKVRIAVSGAAAPDGNNYIISYVDGVLTITSRPSSGSSTTVPVITVPVSSDKETVKVGASVSNGVADVRITKRQLEQVTADTDSVTVDVSGLQNVSSAKLPSAIVEKVGQSGADLTVTLPTGSVTLDSTALAAVGNGKDMTISVQKVALTNAQRDAVGTLAQVAAVVDVNVLTGAAKCSSFNGGKLTVSIPYTLKAGEDPTKLQVWFIRDDGSIENMGGSYDRKTGCFVFSTEHLSCYLLVSTAGMQRFADVPASAYYAEAVAWAVENDITGGTSATTFDPNGFCTRAQTMTFLWRAAGSPTPKSTAMPFMDVPAGSYYYDAVLWAIENGITKGTSDTTFGPNVSCSRGQIVTFLWRSQNSPDAVVANPFTDVAADAYYTNAVLWAVGKSITGGTSTTTFSPSANCNRAQIVTLLHRMYQGN